MMTEFDTTPRRDADVRTGDESNRIEEPASSGAGNGGRRPWERLREAARNALSQRMTMETSDLAHRIRRIHDQSDMQP